MTDQPKPLPQDCPALAALRAELRQHFETLLAFCAGSAAERLDFARLEAELQRRVSALAGRLVEFFLLRRHRTLQLRLRYNARTFRLGAAYAQRQLQTVFGTVTYGRAYLRRRKGGCGYHPLDMALGLTRDGYSPGALGFLGRLASRLSYAAAQLVCRCAWGWAPSTETLQRLVLGLGQYARGYVASGQWWRCKKKRRREGGILVIEADGKCPPTATAEELAKRRCPRRARRHCCQRHRGQQQRRQRGSKPRRRKGDKSKNGREAMVLVMYTLRRGVDGRLHGPVNKKVWATFAGRTAAAAWARAEATRRGFPPGRNRDVQIVVDGAQGLADKLRPLFAGALFTLDVRHVEERLWAVGRTFHQEGSAELAAWVQQRQELLYQRAPQALLGWLRAEEQRLHGVRRSGAQRQALAKLIHYLEPRQAMLGYAYCRRKDLVLASGQVEGAVRYVVADRLDGAGMRWIVANAESVLQLRCLEINGDWEDFLAWVQCQNRQRLRRHEEVKIRIQTPIAPTVAA